MEKRKHPLMNLLLIPAAAVLDILLIWAGGLLDNRLFSQADTLGHPFPVFTLIAFLIAVVISIILIIISIVLTVKGLRKKNNEKN